MPRKVDYPSRFEFFRRAAFEIVRDRGVGALSRRSVAQQLGTSRGRVDDVLRADADLRVLAADQVRTRRRSRGFGVRSDDPMEVALSLVRSVIPDADERVDEELVWLRLLVESPRAHVSCQDPEGPLWAQYQVAQRGYVYADRTDCDGGDGGDRGDSANDQAIDQAIDPLIDPLAEHLEDRERAVVETLTHALQLLGLDDARQAAELPRLRAVVDGLTYRVCTGQVSPADGVRVVQDHLTAITRSGSNRDRAA